MFRFEPQKVRRRDRDRNLEKNVVPRLSRGPCEDWSFFFPAPRLTHISFSGETNHVKGTLGSSIPEPCCKTGIFTVLRLPYCSRLLLRNTCLCNLPGVPTSREMKRMRLPLPKRQPDQFASPGPRRRPFSLNGTVYGFSRLQWLAGPEVDSGRTIRPLPDGVFSVGRSWPMRFFLLLFSPLSFSPFFDLPIGPLRVTLET